MTMTRQQHKDLSDLLTAFYKIEPTEMDDLVNNRWHPFLSTLHSDADRAFALTAYFDLVNHNFSQLLIHLGQLSEAELAVFRPMLSEFLELEQAFRAVTARA